MSGQFVFSATLKVEGSKAKAEVDATTQSVKKLGDEAAKAGAKQGVAANDVRKIGAAGAEASGHLNGLTAAERRAAQGAMDLAREAFLAKSGLDDMGVTAGSLGQKIGAFGGTAAGAILSVLNPVNLLQGAVVGVASAMVQWLFESGQKAEDVGNKLKAVTDAAAATQTQIDKLRFGVDEDYQVELLREQIQLRSQYNMKVAELNGYLANTTHSVDRQRIQTEVLRAEIETIAAKYNENAAALELQANRAAQLAILEGQRAQLAGELAAKEQEAARAAEELRAKVMAIVSAMASVDGSRLVAAFQSAFPVASQLLGVAREIMATIGTAQAQEAAYQSAKTSQLAAQYAQYGAGRASFDRHKGGLYAKDSWSKYFSDLGAAPAGGGGGGGGGGAAARDEADALQDLIDSLNDEIAALREHDPIQKEMLRHREALAGATEAERQKVEDLIATREREKATLEGLREISGMVGDSLIDALMGADDAGKRLIETLIRAGLEAALLGKGPLAGLFGGQDSGGFLGMLFKSIVPGIGAGKAAGGMVHGPGDGSKDTFLTPTANGEFIVNARATARHRHLLEAINAGGRVRGFAEGGYVGAGGGMAPANGRQRPIVQIINQSPEPIREAEGAGPDAEGTVTLIVGKAIGDGRFDRQHQSRFGLTPKVARR